MDDLFEAIGSHDPECKKLQELLAVAKFKSLLKVADDGSGYTPVTYAVYKKNTDGLKHLLNHKGDPTHIDGNGDNSLELALGRNDPKTVQFLLKNGANPHQHNGLHCYPLYFAVEYCHVDIVRMLVTEGADPEYKGTGGVVTPLQFARNSLKKSPANRHWVTMVSILEKAT